MASCHTEKYVAFPFYFSSQPKWIRRIRNPKDLWMGLVCVMAQQSPAVTPNGVLCQDLYDFDDKKKNLIYTDSV